MSSRHYYKKMWPVAASSVCGGVVGWLHKANWEKTYSGDQKLLGSLYISVPFSKNILNNSIYCNWAENSGNVCGN